MLLASVALVLAGVFGSSADAATPSPPAVPPRLERGPVELGVFLSTLLVPPFQRRHAIGLDAGVRLSDLAAVELSGSYAPDLGQGHWTRSTRTLIEQNKVAPKLAHIYGTLGVAARLSPIHGSVAAADATRFDVYALLGTGIARYQPALSAIHCTGDPCVIMGAQTSPTATLGAGVRIGRHGPVAARIELRATSFALMDEHRQPFRRDDCELRVGASWGGKARRRLPAR